MALLSSASRHRLVVVAGLLLFLLSSLVLIVVQNSRVSGLGINQELSFEGKIVTTAGLNVPNGTYNMEFKIYSGGTATGGGTLDWTEDWLVGNSQGVTINSGTLQVNLGSITAFGSSIDWNSSPLYLSLQIGNSASCTPAGNFTANCGGDGEMKPYILLTSVPYAMNSNELGGVGLSAIGQLAATQTWTGANTIQDSATNALDVSNGSGTPLIVVDTTNSVVGIGAAPSPTGSTLQITGNTTTTGNINLSTANSIITGNTGLVLQETGDQYGNVSLSLQNRTGMNGALFSNPSIDLVDFAFDPSSGVQQNIRYEHRPCCIFGTGNSGGEFQIGPPGAPNFTIGAGTTAVRNGSFAVGTIAPTADLTVHTVTDTATAFNVQNSSSQSILTADTTNNQIVLGTSSTINGQASFASSGGTNTITLAAPTTNPTTTYALNLPIVAPATGQCLLSGATTATQLISGITSAG